MNESNQKNKKSPKKEHFFLSTVLPTLIVIGCLVVGVIYIQNPRMWSDLFSPAPTLENLTGTWKNAISGRGLIIWLSKTTDKWYYDIELHLTQTGNTITGWIKETLYNAPISWSHEPITAWITDGSVNGVNLKFKVGSMQWTGTFLSWSMKGVVQGQGWEGTFGDLKRI